MSDRNRHDAADAAVDSGVARHMPEAGVRGEAPTLGPASLGGREGLGLLTVVRDTEGKLIEANGSWRQSQEVLDLGELRAQFPIGATTTFTGPMVQQQYSGPSDEVTIEVVITRLGEYQDQGGGTLRMVNFVAESLG